MPPCAPAQQRQHNDSSGGNDSNDNCPPQHVNECSVCEAEPKRMEQVWNVGCRHGFCGDCMLARLSQRERRCMYCRAQIVRVVDASGTVPLIVSETGSVLSRTVSTDP